MDCLFLKLAYIEHYSPGFLSGTLSTSGERVKMVAQTLFSLSNVQFSFLKVKETGDCSPTRMLKGKVL